MPYQQGHSNNMGALGEVQALPSLIVENSGVKYIGSGNKPDSGIQLGP